MMRALTFHGIRRSPPLASWLLALSGLLWTAIGITELGHLSRRGVWDVAGVVGPFLIGLATWIIGLRLYVQARSERKRRYR